MRIAVVHGYYLHDSGSGIYVREIARELVRQGHDVTLVCQERDPGLYDFIDSVYVLGPNNEELVPQEETRERLYKGRCRLVRPRLSRLLVYVNGPFPGFEARWVCTFQDSAREWIEAYARENVTALGSVFAAWPPELVLANHAMMQPYIVKHALMGRASYVATVHGSELNFSVKRDSRLVEYTLDGLESAAAIVAVSEASAADLVAWALREGRDIETKTLSIPPGVDVHTFVPAPDRLTAITALRRDIPQTAALELGPKGHVIAYAGRLLWTKGVQHAVASLALIVERFPQVQLLVAGDGPARVPLEQLASLLGEGRIEDACALAGSAPELQTSPEAGPVVSARTSRIGRLPLHFLGHLTSAQLGRLYAAADVSLAPSVFPEAVGLVTIEALSAGALPLASYHSGLASVVDVVAEALADPEFKSLAPGQGLTEEIARLAIRTLSSYPTADTAFRAALHDLCQLHFPSWEKVAKRYLELA